MIVSICNEIVLDDEGIFAGGLGVLEGGKFYTLASKNIEYLVLTPLYVNGYIKYEFKDEDLIPIKSEFPRSLMEKLKEVHNAKITIRNEEIETVYYEYSLNKAKIIYIRPRDDSKAEELLGRLYDHRNHRLTFYRYLYFSKASLNFLEKIGLENIKIIDIQESFFAFIPLLLNKIKPKIRLVLHTPVPWGHPSFNRELFKEEFGYEFLEKEVNMTNLAAALCDEIIAVSKKHYEITKKMLPHFSKKITYVTNGVDIERWMNPELLKLYQSNSLNKENFSRVKNEAKKRLLDFFRKKLKEDRITIGWTRRTVQYKRPYFILNFIQENEDLEANFILAGKADPSDFEGLSFMKSMKGLSDRRNNVVYLWDYNVQLAKLIFQGIDLNVFTPLSGWEASGTSMMKAAINGVPTLSSKDGASLEFIVDGLNGWFFGEDLKELVIPNSYEAGKINEKDYEEFSRKLKEIIKLWYDEKDKFLDVAINAIKTSINFVSSERMIKEYYGTIINI